jgi:3-phosphoshikimate 1-carboxyvinyltransferase
MIKPLVSAGKKIGGVLIPPPDKSITHRAVFLAALSPKSSRIRNPLLSGDCLSTIRCFQELGVPVTVSPHQIIVHAGMQSQYFPYRVLKRPENFLYCGNSGTTMRLISGVLAAQPLKVVLKGDESLSKRPMKRVIEPLNKMGALIYAKHNNYPPLVVLGNLHLTPLMWKTQIASAQVKSAILLAGLFAKGKTTVIEPFRSRDHTERMLKGLGAQIRYQSGKNLNGQNKVSIQGYSPLKGLNMTIPGDFSSAAFFIGAALMVPHSKLTIRNVNLNSTRAGLLRVLRRMGAKIQTKNVKEVYQEPLGDVQAEYSQLKGTTVLPGEIPTLIDEIPILAVIATQAKGTTTIRGAEELRVKETDRIAAIVNELKKMGADIQEKKDGCVIQGPTPLRGNSVQSYADHRMAMSLAVAGLIAKGKTTIQDFDCIKISYPNFLKDLKKILFLT